METVIETPAYLRQAKAIGMTDAERATAIDYLMENPEAGDIVVGSGGLRKVRVAGRGKGKSGGYRVFTFHVSERGVCLLWVLSKGQDANLTAEQVAALAKVVKGLPQSFA